MKQNTWTFLAFAAFAGLAGSQPAPAQTITCPVPLINSLYDVEPWDPNPANITPGVNIIGGTVGVPFVTYQITATGSPTSFGATLLPPGLAVNTVTGAITGTPTVANEWFTTITATNACGTDSVVMIIVIAPANSPPLITSLFDVQPWDPDAATVAVASNVVSGTVGVPFVPYQITATGSPTSFGAVLIPPGLAVDPVAGAITGTPTVAGTWFTTISATNAYGTGTAVVIITIVPQSFSRIANFSARAMSGPGSQMLMLGFAVTGGNKTLLVRGVGPGLAAYGISNSLPDPQLTLFSGNNPVATNVGWQTSAGAANMQAVAARVGAFALQTGSMDSALMAVVGGGAYTAEVTGVSSDTGTALAEVYEADSNPGARLVNASARLAVAGGGLNPLTIGFVIAGNTQKTVLIRGVGPTLATLGVAGALANPQITLFSGGTQIASNSNWGAGNDVAQMNATFAQVGAFLLPTGSLDAALIAILQPGAYTVQIVGVGNTGGVALLEVYDVQ